MIDTVTPVGRIVWGNPLNGKPKTDNQGNTVTGQDGQPLTEWSFGLAIDKNQTGEVFQAMQTAAAEVFPNGAPADFSWKYKDGDGVDDKGQPFSNREGYAGCVVLAISTSAFAPKVVRLDGGAYVQMEEGVKTGDYARVALNIKAHGGKPGVRGAKSGLYLNPTMIEFCGYGEAINNGPDPNAVFGGQAPALPPGASATPQAGQGAMPGQHPTGGAGAPTAPAGAPGMPGAGAPANPTASPGNAPPAHDFVQNAAQSGATMPGQAQPQQPQVGQPGAAGMPGMPGMPGQG